MSVRWKPKAIAATTATGNSRDYSSPDGVTRGHLIVNITGSPTGTTPAVVVKLQGKGSSGTYYDLPSAATSSLTAAGQTVVAVATIPKTWRAVWTVTGTTPSIVLGVDVDGV